MNCEMERYFEEDANLGIFKGKTVAVIGYGSQGRGQSLNLRDSGVSVIIGLRKGKSWQKANEEGFEVFSVPEAVQRADLIQILLPDEQQAAVYRNEIQPHLREGMCLSFSHGF
jgi:ketol-acid reductoisomerase (EC 1.1.1.86)